MVMIGPSLMCAKLDDLNNEMQRLEEADVDYYHFDIMDGQFVPNFTFGPDLIKALRDKTDKPFDIHLMVNEPDSYIELFHSVGSDMISVHVESVTHLHRTLEKIKGFGMKAGVALNPSTPLDSIQYVADIVDYVCLMSVNPGFAGQKFIPSIYKKIEQLQKFKTENNYEFDIQVDGNISFEVIPKAVNLGATMLVVGTSSLFNQDQGYKECIDKIKISYSSTQEMQSK